MAVAQTLGAASNQQQQGPGMGVRIVEKAIGGNVLPLQANRFTRSTDGVVLSAEAQDACQPLPPVVYGYIRVVAGDEVRATILKADLLVFCCANGFMHSTVFTDFGVDDTAVARPGFASLLDVCRLVGSYGVVVPARTHLSSFAPTLDVLTRQLRRTGTKLLAVDEVTAAGPSGMESIAHREEA
ncbi:hypothetical protein JOF56_004175 [Kibdelosporangium banguiense]|uniref:Uncharacterized protein n=1 Tax=Kibdelosporangium banguiense TaxID=1365924 RepID=A0ABS4TH82_9PSEU|nr:recombinase family protein [Kibdelosporangium banguiense]MBP2323790.1 hypothetical protein [Kibdelosporangium banguiense]